MSEQELQIRFTYHRPTQNQVEKMAEVREKALEFAKLIVKNSPYSVEQTRAINKIEEAVMLVNAGIVRREEHVGNEIEDEILAE